MTGAGSWSLEVPEAPGVEWVNGARLAISDGWLGSQAVPETLAPVAAGDRDRAGSAVRMSGLYGPEPPGELLSGPAWTPTGWRGEGDGWQLDLRRATVAHRLRLGERPVVTARWSQVDEPGAQVFHAPTAPAGVAPCPPTALSFLDGAGGRIGALAVGERRGGDSLLRVAVARIGRDRGLAGRAASEACDRLLGRGPEALAASQRRGWAGRWSGAGVSIGGDQLSEVRTRYALYQLLSMSDCPPELAVGARGLTGPGYFGHVFWDADVFVLPALASLAPPAAEAMVAYRLNRLDAARSAAAAEGAGGARYPWESAATGRDVTPRSAIGPTGEPVDIRTGDHELHIGADVCWAIVQLVRWTGCHGLLAGPAGEVIREVARWWASRGEIGADGRAHLRDVIGPDEYHERVDDNAFTNRMAAWTLRQAAGLARAGQGASQTEAAGWERLAGALVDGYRADLGRHEQFDGYDSLDPVLAETIAPVPFPADLLLGLRRVQRSQLIKQADVLMLHQMIPDAMPPGSCGNDLDHYLPRTSHGSSLSPAIHAGLLAAAGRPDEALGWFRMALALDLDDLTGTTAGGIHLANIGGAWQALLGGFLGVRACPGGLSVSPSLPAAWRDVEVRFTYRQAAVEVRATHRNVVVEASNPIPLVVDGAAPVVTGGVRLGRDEGRWVRR